MERRVTLPTPKQIDDFTQITGATLDYCHFREDAIIVSMNGGKLSERIPLEGLSETDRELVERFAAMLCRVAGIELCTGAAKSAARAKQEAEARRMQEEKRAEKEREEAAEVEGGEPEDPRTRRQS